jgi:hypothetical protein
MPMPTALRDRIRRALDHEYGAHVQVRESLYLRAPDGRGTVFALAENSAWEECIHSHPDEGSREEIAEQCRGELGLNGGSDTEHDPDVPCANQHLVRIDVEAPRGHRRSELTIDEGHLDSLGCTVASVRTFALRDVDGDGERELELDVIGVNPLIDTRTSAAFRIQKRTLGYYRDDLSAQYAQTLTEVGSYPSDAGGNLQEARRVRFEDVNRDGHVDMLFDIVAYERWPNRGCHEDDVGWPRVTQRHQRRCSGQIEHETWLYDAARDEWVDPSL